MSHKKQSQKQKYTVTIPEQLYNVLTKEAQVLSMTPDNLATARLIECYQNEDLWDADNTHDQKINETGQPNTDQSTKEGAI